MNVPNYELIVGDGYKNLLWWPLVILDVAVGSYEKIVGWDIH